MDPSGFGFDPWIAQLPFVQRKLVRLIVSCRVVRCLLGSGLYCNVANPVIVPSIPGQVES